MLLPFYHMNLVEAGCDEAGRGCLAGPVFAAAVILPPDFTDPLITDSKQLGHKQRESLRKVIEHHAIDWAVESVWNEEIDRINILNASIKAMHLAIGKLTRTTPQHLLVDGNQFKPFHGIPHTCIVKGDSKYLSIAAASILAKTHRDKCMVELHEKYPQYEWNINKGYPTLKHRQRIEQYGISPFHRKSFKFSKCL